MLGNVIRAGFKISPGPISIYVLAGPLLSIVLKEILFHKTFRVGRETRSTAVIANAWHHRSDAFSSIPPIVAIIAARINPELRFLDQIAAVIIAVFIFKVAFSVVKPAIAELTEKGISEEEINSIKEIIQKQKEVKEVHKIRSRHIGEEIFVDLHMLVDQEMSVLKAHEIARQAQDDVINSLPRIIDIVIHIEPFI